MTTTTLRAAAGALPEPAVARIAAAVRAGQLVAFPTATVYGLGGSGLDPGARGRLFEIKGRDSRKALPILVQSTHEARRWAVFGPLAEPLAERFWPGPLTLVLAPTAEGRALLSGESSSLAIRVPGHALTRGLIAASGVPWATTSANPSGLPPLGDGRAVAAAFAGKVAYVIDDGEAPGMESTVVAAQGARARILRAGALDRRQLAQAGVELESE